MGKLEEGGRYASFTKSWMISWVTGQHVLAALLDTGTTTNSSSVLEDPLSDGTEEREPVNINNITMSYRISLHAHVISHIALDDDVHGNSPLDSTIISQAAGGTQSTRDREPGDETSVGV